ncbi:GTPase SAR1 family protein [Chryseobacterium rhizosphaerae]|uniref:GTPase SAR1 family protein n=1 Tax=Chryseobacterium rhizosphaerae TaxID=395937 RepID=A0AAE3Y7Z1_9FLAO|nr:COR domain-containing protein [Chryseobacterium rhizosphaerae]MDR6525321.1 GTPase SAR1 family protein [Chryseobacterium rhizosphaerae]
MNIVKRNLYVLGNPGPGKNFIRKVFEEIMFSRNHYLDDRYVGSDWTINTHNNISIEVEIKDYTLSNFASIKIDSIVIFVPDSIGKEFWKISEDEINFLKILSDTCTVIFVYPPTAESNLRKGKIHLMNVLPFIEYFVSLPPRPAHDAFEYLNEFSTIIRQIIINSHPDSLLYAKKLIKENYETQNPILDLGNCGLTSLKNLKELFQNVHLEELILSNEWGEYDGTHLKHRTSNNHLEPNILFGFPEEIGKLQNLKVLIAGGNWNDPKRNRSNYFSRWYINDITPLSKLKKIIALNLSNNEIQTAQPLADLINLKYLHINNNQIKYFPKITCFPKLTILYLSNNRIDNLDFLVGESVLSLVDLHANQITDLSPIIELISRLDIVDSQWENSTISIANNPLSIPPAEVVSKGKSNVLAYFTQLEAEKNIQLNPYLNSDIKLILVGNSNVGKSTFVGWLKTNKVDKNLATTHWLDFGIWKTSIKGKDYTIRVFDFGGQEYYHETHHLFFTNRTAYVLLWDRSSNDFGKQVVNQRQKGGEEQEVEIETFPLEYWLDSIRYHTNKKKINQPKNIVTKILEERNDQFKVTYMLKKKWIPDSSKVLIDIIDDDSEILYEEEENILVLQNKVDSQKEKLFINEESLKGTYPKIYDFDQISLFSNKGLTRSKNTLFDIFNSLEILNSQYLGTWNYIKQNIENQNFQDSFSDSEFCAYCNSIIKALPELVGRSKKQKDKVFFSLEDAKVFASFLSDIGLCLYYPENDQLKDRIFLNQGKILNDLTKILLEIDRNNGEISKNAIAKTLGESQSANAVSEVIKLMLHFKILFKHPISSKKSYIAPLYLPDEPPKSIKLFEELFERPTYRYKYKTFIHKSIILDFFHEYGAKTLSETSDDSSFYYWKNGILVKNENCKDIIMVKFVPWNKDDQCALLDVFALKGTGEEFVNEIVKYIDSINTGIRVTKLVPDEKGEKFVPLEIIHENEEHQNAVFHFENKYYKLQSFRKYLKSPLKMKKIFISYSKQDLTLVNKFIEHLSALQRDGKVSHWYCSALEAGSAWNEEIQKHFEESDIVCFMVSPNFMKTEYIHEHEIKKAFERKKADPGFKIIPIILNFCRWTTTNNNLGDYTALPYTAKPIMDFHNQDMGWYITEACLRIMIDNDLDPKGDDFYQGQALPTDVLKIYERIVGGKIDNNTL